MLPSLTLEEGTAMAMEAKAAMKMYLICILKIFGVERQRLCEDWFVEAVEWNELCDARIESRLNANFGLSL